MLLHSSISTKESRETFFICFFLSSLFTSFLSLILFCKDENVKEKRKIKKFNTLLKCIFLTKSSQKSFKSWKNLLVNVLVFNSTQFNSIQLISIRFNSIQFDSIRCILKMESKNSYLITLKDIIDWDVDDLSKMIV